jgi:hypothetical protein
MSDQLDNGSAAAEPMTAPMSEDAAAEAIFNILPEEDEEQNASPPEDNGEPPEEGEYAADDADPADAEPGDEAYDLDKLHGNTRIRLRDGTEWSVGDLKRRIAEVREVDRAKQEFQANASRFQQYAQQTAQQAQIFQQLVPQAIAALQTQLPDVPPPPTAEETANDPFAATEKLAAHLNAKAARDAKEQEIAQLRYAQQMQVAQAQQQQATRMKEYLQQEQGRLLERLPELRDEGRRRAFYSEFIQGGQEYGFTQQELGGVADSRLLAVMRDALAYRKAVKGSKAPQVQQKTQNATPVRQPGRRVTPSESTARQDQEDMARLRKTGRPDDALALIMRRL